MGNQTLICLNKNGEWMQQYPFLIVSITIEMLIFIPLLFQSLLDAKDWLDVTSISRTWRLAGAPVALFLILLPMIIIYMLVLPYETGGINCSPGGAIGIMWTFVVLVTNVYTFNPKYKSDEKTLGEKEVNSVLDTEFLSCVVKGEYGVMIHKWSAFLLFVFMYVTTALVVFMVLIGTDRYGAGLLIFVLMTILLVSLIASTFKPGWCPKTSLVEYSYCLLFGIIPSLITDAQIID